MKKCITIIKHVITLAFIALCAYEVSHVLTKWINKESFQGKALLLITKGKTLKIVPKANCAILFITLKLYCF